VFSQLAGSSRQVFFSGQSDAGAYCFFYFRLLAAVISNPVAAAHGKSHCKDHNKSFHYLLMFAYTKVNKFSDRCQTGFTAGKNRLTESVNQFII